VKIRNVLVPLPLCEFSPEAGGPPPIGCYRLLIQHIRSYQRYSEAASSVRDGWTQHARQLTFARAHCASRFQLVAAAQSDVVQTCMMRQFLLSPSSCIYLHLMYTSGNQNLSFIPAVNSRETKIPKD
jgi:hypothetical protein